MVPKRFLNGLKSERNRFKTVLGPTKKRLRPTCRNVAKSMPRQNHKKTVLKALAQNHSWKKGVGRKSGWYELKKTVWRPLGNCKVGDNIVETGLRIMPQNPSPSGNHPPPQGSFSPTSFPPNLTCKGSGGVDKQPLKCLARPTRCHGADYHKN